MKTSALYTIDPGRLLVVMVWTLVMPASGLAQDRFALELRPGVGFPTRNLAGADLKTGFGVEGVVAWHFMKHLGVYAGWGWSRFDSRGSFAGADARFEESGYTYGLQLMHVLGQSNVSLLGRAGVLSNHIEVEDHRGHAIGDSGHGFSEGIGWQVEVRAVLPLAERWSVFPSLRYRSLPRAIRIGADDTDVVLSYVSLGIGVVRTF